MTAGPFADLDAYVALPRLSGLALSPDGARLVTTVATLSPDRKKYVSALWEVDPLGAAEPRQLTRSAQGESAPAFLADGSLLFTSKRPDPQATEPPEEEVTALWQLPADGGEARLVARRAGGIDGVRTARDAPVAVVLAPTMAGTRTAAEDADARKARRETDVSAILHEAMPVRLWDADLGPAQLRLLAASDVDGQSPVELRDLTPEPGRALDEQGYDLTPDGGRLVTGWAVPLGGGDERADLVLLDTTTGKRRVLATDPEGRLSFTAPAVSPDGRHAVCVRWTAPTWDDPPDQTLELVDLATGDRRELTPDLDLWPRDPVFGEDAVYFLADEAGHAPVFRVDLADDTVTRLTGSGAYTDLCPSPDRRFVYALRSSYDSPPVPVRIDITTASQEPVRLTSPGSPPELPGRVEEVSATAADGVALRAWLVLPPDTEGPVPLVLWIHGGPLGSWNGWSWRWCPHVLAARGYAVLLPDPALSTGYGREFVRRGWGEWGGRPYTDLLTITDAALERPDLDAGRTAAMGGSFGGYMANWVAGHTDRFRAIVTHASLWALEQFQGTTDSPAYWAKEWAYSDVRPERYEANSPHRHADAISTPMLVIHGDKDYRVPIGEGLRLWNDLVRREVPAQFLYFPDENHWVLKPGNTTVWYDAVLAFLERYVRDEPVRRPRLV